MNLNHLHLHVRDREAAERFYAAWMGLKVARRGQRLTFMTDAAGFELALMDDPAPGPMPSWFHFGFRLPSAQQVTDLHDQMRASGIVILKPLYQDESLVSFRCEGPEGYPIELYWEAPGAGLD